MYDRPLPRAARRVLALGEVPSVFEDLVVDLGGLQLSDQLRRDRRDRRLEALVEPAHGNDVLRERLALRLAQLGAERTDVVEQAAGLVLLGDEPGEGEQAVFVVAGLDDPWRHAQAFALLVGDDVHLGDVEPELVKPLDALLDPPQLVELELLGGGQLLPQRRVAILDVRRHRPRVDILDEATTDLQVEQAAGHVLGGDLEVHLALAIGERRVPLRRLDVDDERRQRTGVAAEQRVRQRAVAPEEPGQVKAYEQPDEGVEEALAEIGDAQPATRQQRAVRQRVVEVAGDEQAVPLTGPFGDGGDDVDGRQLVLVQAAQQPVLAEHEMVGKFLDDVGPAAVPLPNSTRRTTWRCSPDTSWMLGNDHSSRSVPNGSRPRSGCSAGEASCRRIGQPRSGP